MKLFLTQKKWQKAEKMLFMQMKSLILTNKYNKVVFKFANFYKFVGCCRWGWRMD